MGPFHIVENVFVDISHKKVFVDDASVAMLIFFKKFVCIYTLYFVTLLLTFLIKVLR